jgi:hypothetical protein
MVWKLNINCDKHQLGQLLINAVEFSILNFAIPRIAGNIKEDLSFQHKQKQEETNIHSL